MSDSVRDSISKGKVKTNKGRHFGSHMHTCEYAPEHMCTGTHTIHSHTYTHTHVKFEREVSISLEGYIPINPL